MEYHFRAIGRIHSCFREKFGIPRQAGLVPEARGTLELFAPFHRREYLEGLEKFSHIWLQYVFHAASMGPSRSKVRPPRLGGNRRMGVFGTRSNFRPNPIGLSVVELEGIVTVRGGTRLLLKGIDLLDQTPVLDIKPYLPYADARAGAIGGYAHERPLAALPVRFVAGVREVLRGLPPGDKRRLARLIVQVLRLDPRPAYQGCRFPARVYGIRLDDWNVRWRLENNTASVVEVTPWTGPPDVRRGAEA